MKLLLLCILIDPVPTDEGGLTSGAVAGIVLSVLFAVALLSVLFVIVAYFVYKRFRSRSYRLNVSGKHALSEQIIKK